MRIDIPEVIFALLLALAPPCLTEDSTNCGWGATRRGNRAGVSFVSVASWMETQEARAEVLLRAYTGGE